MNVWVCVLFMGCVSAVRSCPAACSCHGDMGVDGATITVDCSNRGLTDIPIPDTIPTNTRTLNMSKNSLSTANLGKLASLTNLKTLDFSLNSLSSISSLPTLGIHFLNLSTNLFTTIDPDLLIRFHALRDLDLSSNRLGSIPLTSNGLHPLSRLNLASNDIDVKSIRMTLHLPNLEYLDLSANRIVMIPSKTFLGVTSLRELRLARAGIKEVNAEAFLGLDKLTTMDLSDNMFSKLEPAMFNTLPQLRLLILADSKLLCDCNSRYLKDEVGRRNIQLPEPTLCFVPKRQQPYDIRVTDMSPFCPDSQTLIVPKSLPVITCETLTSSKVEVSNMTSSTASIRLNPAADISTLLSKVTVRNIGGPSRYDYQHLIIQRQSEIVFPNLDLAIQYVVCLNFSQCDYEICTLLRHPEEGVTPGGTPALAKLCHSDLTVAVVVAVVVSVMIMLLLFIPFFILLHKLCFFIERKRKRRAVLKAAPGTATLAGYEKYVTIPANERPTGVVVNSDTRYFNRSYVDVNAEDDMIWGNIITKDRPETAVNDKAPYLHRIAATSSDNYEELQPDDDRNMKFLLGRSPSQPTGTPQLDTRSNPAHNEPNQCDGIPVHPGYQGRKRTLPSDRNANEIVMNPGQLEASEGSLNTERVLDLERVVDPDRVLDPERLLDRKRVLGAKHGTPHFNEFIPSDFLGPGNYEELSDTDDTS